MTDPVTTMGMDPRDRRTHVERLGGAVAQETDTMLSDAQFAELKALLVEMLTPGMECAKLMLPELQRQAAAHAAAEEPKPQE